MGPKIHINWAHSYHPMKVILSGGGTGGHIYPALALADALKKHAPATDILFVGARGKMEMQKVPEAGYPIVGLKIRGLQRKQVLQNVALPCRLVGSLWQARKILKDFRPDVVVGTGGYASAPILYMAAKRQIPTLIQEQNAAVGLANQLLARYVDRICVAYEGMEKYFPAEKIVLTGNPVREDLLHLAEKRQAAYQHFGLVPAKPCLLVLGGSLGAQTINASILQGIDQLMEAGLQVIWATGRLYFAAIQAQLTQQQRAVVKVYPFIAPIDLAYAAADMVVSRAGALAVAELCVAQKPVIFVPSPNVTADHQTQNVLPLVEKNAALMVKDDKAMQMLLQAVIGLLQLEARQRILAKNMRDWARPQATAAIREAIIALAKPARSAAPTAPYRMRAYPYVYLLGIGGMGMSAVARWFNAQPVQVFGYDRAATALTDQLTQEGIQLHFEDRVEAIPAEITHHKEQSLIVYTPAISTKNQLLSYLKANNYTVCKRAEVLGMITQRQFTLAVAGTHGKTTTSSLAAHLLHSAGKSMVGFLGGIAKGYGTNLLVNGPAHEDPIVVIEADEFDRLFLRLQTDLAIVTTVNPDHLDTYGDAQGFKDAFKAFIGRVPPAGKAIVHQKVAQQLQLTKGGAHIVCYALTDAVVRAEHVCIKQGDFYFDYVSEATTIRGLRLAVPGYHNVENALAVITACLALGLDAETIREGMATFQGIKRRFDYVIRTEQLVFLDDYAHHPAEIAALLQTIRLLYPDKKLTAVFRPNLFTRTRDFAGAFAQSLDLADQVFLLDVYPDREEPIEGVSSACIFEQMTLDQKFMCTSANLLDALGQQGKPAVIVLMGSGGTSSFVPLIKDFLLAQWG